MFSVPTLSKTLAHSYCLSTRSLSHYVTTPIFYVNAAPHIGHVYTLLVADALNRFERLKSPSSSTIFSAGTDEHGIKIQNAAERAGLTCLELCDQNADKFKQLCHVYDTTVTDFIRTTEPRHVAAVQNFWQELDSRGYIQKTTYSGWYCESEETFVPDYQVIDKGNEKFDTNGNKLVWSDEENYVFKYTELKGRILAWLQNDKPIKPAKFNEEAIKLVEQQSDISISRPRKRLSWGIQVPSDQNQTIYVWLDALVNYLTVAGYPGKLSHWPIECQVIGKDILKFHAIYWPAFLAAMNMDLPKSLVCHSHWLTDSQKISKSRGNVVDPIEENQFLTSQGLRYYLIRSGVLHSDTNYNREMAIRRVNDELANTFGNLMSRCCSKKINPNQIRPSKFATDPDQDIKELLNMVNDLQISSQQLYDDANLYKCVDQIMSTLKLSQKLYESKKPWNLIKQTDDRSTIDHHNIQMITFETLRVCSILLQPIVPTITNSALNQMNVDGRSLAHARIDASVGDPKCDATSLAGDLSVPLFPRLI